MMAEPTTAQQGGIRPDALVLRAPREGDGPALETIQAAGIATGHATFRETALDWPAWHAAYGGGVALVAESAGTVLGWAAIASASDRCVYSGVGETSVYVDPAAGSRGIGRLLLTRLVEASEGAGYWSLFAQIFPENVASLRVHEHAGFRRVGTRERLGRMTYGPFAGRWRDVVFLERRSAIVGCD